jgi:hypothetical protein
MTADCTLDEPQPTQIPARTLYAFGVPAIEASTYLSW